MKTRRLMLLTGSSLLAIATSTPAQDTAGAGFQLEEVVVTARRRAESLQDVPQTVDAVTAEDVAKLNFQNFTDVQAIVPGLTMSSGATGYTTAATIRGASFQVESSATPTVEFYLNDGPIQSALLFQQMYDIGQIEVLRGPQGTLRGRASPSGSITVTTKQADVSEFGGYVSALGTDQDAYQGQAAINLPIIQDSLALRIAGIYDENEYDHVETTDGQKPSQRTKSGRASLRWEAGDVFTANVMYQYLERDLKAFDQYSSFFLANGSTAPAGVQTIRPEDRLSVFTDGGRPTTQQIDMATAQLDWRLGGQKLSYVGSWSKLDVQAQSPLDLGGVVPNTPGFAQSLHSQAESKAHELRLASEERLAGRFDYTVGAYYQEFSSPSDLTNYTLFAIPVGPYTLMPVSVPPNPTLPPGAPGGLLGTPISRRSSTEETSVFANLTWHLTDQTEISGGARYIIFKSESSLTLNNAPTPAQSFDAEEKPTVWNLAASHRFTEDFMLYANVGTSWRDGPDVVGIFNPEPVTPNIAEFTRLDSEDSTSYEVGFKADFLDGRMRLNASVFHQDFENFLYRGPQVWYVNRQQPASPVPGQFNFMANVDGTIDGAEVDLAIQATERFNIGLNFAYAKGEMDNGVVACNDFNQDGIPDLNPPANPSLAQLQAILPAGEDVASCSVNDRMSFAPDWTTTLQAEYTFPVTASLDIFGRGLYSYYTSNEQDPNNQYDDVDSYGLLNLYAGLRSNDGAWEVSLFARNVLDEQLVLNRGSAAASTPFRNLAAGGAGQSLAGPYMTTSMTPLQEFGLSVRYSFGSR
ncbi:MAG TPA: TonB-dependent receptor [Povalibacter sp.]|uniref:TonB-dependent receptor n=1 Tax=Povalibacter sp. TaxID=1962978 RepID=UPI002B9234F1|nr:TonB-dependent receptor [Povalibacter sp.]HMN46025.1 TonB-dependent receptor [Povalibacter sp.]